MDKNTVVEFTGRQETADPLTELLRRGARELLQQAIEAELSTFMEGFKNRRLDDDRAAVVRNGHLPERDIQTGIGPVKVKVPKIRSKDGEPVTFRSALVPPYVRKARSLEAALPWLYLKGVSTGEMEGALSILVGPADGIYSGLRSEESKLCALVVIGVNERGEKHFLAIEDGERESTLSWKGVLGKLKERGMNAPELAIGDGAMGFWAGLEETYPETRQQRCWVHKTANVLNKLPKSCQPMFSAVLDTGWAARVIHDFGHRARQTKVLVALTQKQKAGIGGQITTSEICSDFAAGKG
ncbi:transposase [Microbulbifer sp. 2205BS26-8]|nr:transposase [Microbulbifer sp. 2205BS26-8]MDP5211057.1 transposase [Microbulbifer sp. 2205BS26-8]